MSSITIVGTAYVHKYLDQSEECSSFDVDVLEVVTSSDSPSYPEDKTDFEELIAGCDWQDLPDEEGYFAIQYAATVSWHKDYWGEVDADADVHWSKVTKLSDKEAAYLMDDELDRFKFEDSFEMRP